MWTYLIIIGLVLIAAIILIPIFKTIATIYPYSYPNARIRVMKSNLVTKENFEELIKRPYNSIIYTLEKKAFPDLSKYLSGDFSYGSVDAALRTNLINTLIKIKKISPNKEFTKRLLAKYEIMLIESIARSTSISVNYKQDLIHSTTLFSKEFLYKKEQTVDDLYNELKGTIYQKTFEKHITKIRNKKFEEFEEDLDKLFYKRLLSVADQDQKKYVKLMIDNANISLAFKKSKTRIPGGSIKNIPENIEEIKKIVQKKYKTQKTNINELEKETQQKLRITGEKLMTKNPLSESTIIGFIILKTVNIRNINILLKLKHEGYEENEIRKVLAI
ncbi:MAG: V-type ATPase subunit [Candidatus Woesearchaeota archaeon]